ncbi:ricin B lectin domain-containing protein [Mycena rebaudengoi]|nr:ricin B lectin domain-containing protein [Mycena rebaudengoi]
MALAEGIYSIVSCKAPTCIDLQDGCSDDGTPVRVWQQTSFSGTRVYQETFPSNRCDPRPRDQLWLVRNTTAGHYSLQNLRSGTYLDLWDGNSANGTKIVGHRPMGPNGTPAANQQWEITASGGFYRKVRNAATQTYMNLLGSYIHDGNPVHGWEYTVEEEDALWRFEWLSVTTIDIGRALSNNAHKLEGIEPFEEHDIYFVLRRDLLRDIWRSSDLATTTYRPGVFDHDAFALAYKCAVSKWCLDHIKAVGEFNSRYIGVPLHTPIFRTLPCFWCGCRETNGICVQLDSKRGSLRYHFHRPRQRENHRT